MFMKLRYSPLLDRVSLRHLIDPRFEAGEIAFEELPRRIVGDVVILIDEAGLVDEVDFGLAHQNEIEDDSDAPQMGLGDGGADRTGTRADDRSGLAGP